MHHNTFYYRLTQQWKRRRRIFSKYSRFLSFCHTYTHSRHTNLFHEGQEREGVREAFWKKISDISCYCDQFYLHIGDLQKIKLTGGLGRINSVSHLLIILYTTRVSDAINECSVQYVKYCKSENMWCDKIEVLWL